MSAKEFIQNIRDSFKRKEPLSDEVVEGFLRVLEKVRTEDVTCKEVFQQLDEYVEKEVDNKDAGRLMPLLREHLDMCSDCCDEYEALLNVIEKSTGN
jgi:DNA-binding FrmR family transcriptional regulator